MNSAAYGIHGEISDRRLSRIFIAAVPPVCQDNYGESTAYLVVDDMGRLLEVVWRPGGAGRAVACPTAGF